MRHVPLYIFDLDGTIALIDHRRAILDDKSDPHRWDKFFDQCRWDVPNMPVINTIRHLHYASAEVWIWSGRSDRVRDMTKAWLLKHTTFLPWQLTLCLKMRPEGDYTPDDQLKKQWLDQLSQDELNRLVAVFDDRQKVVDMWRGEGIACFQVAKGDF